MQDSWLNNKVDEMQDFADRNDMKNFYDNLKEVYGPTTSGSSPLHSADGSTLITDKEKILKRWAEHFDSVLNHPSTNSDEAIDWLPQVPFDETLDAVPTFEEIQKVIHLLTSGKALVQTPSCWSLQRRWYCSDRETPPAVPAHLAAWDSSTRL